MLPSSCIIHSDNRQRVGNSFLRGLCLTTLLLKGLCHAVVANFSPDHLAIELTETLLNGLKLKKNSKETQISQDAAWMIKTGQDSDGLQLGTLEKISDPCFFVRFISFSMKLSSIMIFVNHLCLLCGRDLPITDCCSANLIQTITIPYPQPQYKL